MDAIAPAIHWVNLGGVDHYCEWIRQPSETPKPVMVFIHGWGGSARYWESTARAIANQFDCLLYDLRGFGRSARLPPSTSNWELETYADELAALLDHFHLERVYLNGHSVGASIATLFLQRYPQRVKRAILTCSGIFDYNPLTFTAFHQAGSFAVKLRFNWFLNVPLAGRLFMSRFVYRPLDEALNRLFLSDYLLADEAAATGTIYTAVSQHAAEVMPRAFSDIAVPTLLIAGAQDQIIPPKLARRAAALNDRIDYCELPGTAHFPMLEDAKAYLNCLQDFLATPAL